MVTTLDVWFYAFSSGPKARVWQVASIALVWSIWRLRNPVMFHHINFEEE